MSTTLTSPETGTANLTIDRVAVNAALDGRWASLRRESRDLCLEPEFRRVPGLTYAEHRERVLGQLKGLVMDRTRRQATFRKQLEAQAGGSRDAAA